MKGCTVNIKYYDEPFKSVTSTQYQQDNTKCLCKCVMENIFFLNKHLEDIKIK